MLDYDGITVSRHYISVHLTIALMMLSILCSAILPSVVDAQVPLGGSEFNSSIDI
jgi:hypothetical protein